MAQEWLRLASNTSNNPKLVGIAGLAKVPVGTVLAIWTHILCRSRQNITPGYFHDTPTEIANVLGYETAQVEDIIAHMEFRGLLDGNKVCKWHKHQKPSDSSAERVARYRERQAAKKNPEAKIEPKQQVSDVVTLHRPTTKNPHIAAAAAFGKKIMKERGVFEDLRFNQLTSSLTPLFEAGIPEEFIEETMNRLWNAADAKRRTIKSFSYFVGAISDEWQTANTKIEGTNRNDKPQPSRKGASRNTGEDTASRRSAILQGLGFSSEMEPRRTGSD